MMTQPIREQPKKSDKRLQILGAAIRKAQSRSDVLIEILHKAQDLFGYLDKSVLWFIARSLKLSPSRVYGVATFYHLFRLRPAGRHTCVICTGTACFVKGSPRILQEVVQGSGVGLGETSKDGSFSLLEARCVGACGIAPVAVMDGDMIGPTTAERVLNRIKGWQTNGND